MNELKRRPKPTNLLGKLLSKIMYARWQANEKAIEDLWKRNGLDNPTKRQGYKMEELKSVGTEGTEHTTYRLWKLVDQSVVTISSEIKTAVRTGITREDQDDASRATKANPTDSPI